jgi:two-component system, OmpR family, phosphate regulon sensor histidine kinase PhoR
MILRVLAFLLLLGLGAAAGWLAQGGAGAIGGVVLGALLWFIFDTGRGLRVLHWLRGGERSPAPRVGGLWGEAADRMRRALVQREREVQTAQQRLQDFLAAIQRSPNGVVLLDAQGRIEWTNDTAATQFGLDPERDLQQHIVNLVREPNFTAYYHGADYAQDVVIAGATGTPSRPVKLAVRLHPYGEGRLLMLSRDVTAVEQAEIMRRDFVANVSHEIRTPLTVLAGFVETLQHLDLSAPERASYLGLMAQQAGRMQTLVDDLLTLSRLEGSPLPGGGEWTPAGQLLAPCEQDTRLLAATLGKRLELRFAAAPEVEIGGAGGELQSAFLNLASNAVRYTPDGGTVDVGARLLEGGRFEFSVRDTGPGIAAEHLPRLTERFYRVDRSRSRESGGTGLGLAIVKHVVQRHGGELKIESTPGAGSLFAIVLPAARVRLAGHEPALAVERQ